MSQQPSVLVLQSILALTDAQIGHNLSNIVDVVREQRLFAFSSESASSTSTCFNADQRLAQTDEEAQAMLERQTNPMNTLSHKIIERLQSMMESAAPQVSLAGLSLLSLLIREASQSLLKVQHASWARIMLKIVRGCLVRDGRVVVFASANVVARSACETMLQLLQRASLWPDTRRDVSVDHLPPFMPLLLDCVTAGARSADARLAVPYLEVLCDILTAYKASVRNFVSITQDCCSMLLEHSISDVVRLAAAAIALSARCQNVDGWTTAFNRTINSVQDIVFEVEQVCLPEAAKPFVVLAVSSTSVSRSGRKRNLNIDEEKPQIDPNSQQQQPEATLRWSFGPLSDSAVDMATSYRRRVAGLSALLQQLLTLPATSFMPSTSTNSIDNLEIAVLPLIHVLQRLLSCELGSDNLQAFTGNKLTAVSCWMVLLPMQLDCLDVLRALISTAGKQLLPYTAMIRATLLDIFRRTCVPVHSQSRVNSLTSLRSRVYTVLTDFLAVVGSIGSAALFSTLHLQIMADIETPFRRRATPLSDPNNPSTVVSDKNESFISVHSSSNHPNRQSEKQLRIFASAAMHDASMESLNVDRELESIDLLAMYALQLLQSMIALSGQMLALPQRTAVDRMLISLLLASLSSHGQVITFVPSKLRLNLFSALLASLLAPQSSQNAVLPFAVRLFKVGSKDPCPSVRAICHHAFSCLQHIVFPRAPTTHRPHLAVDEKEIPSFWSPFSPIPNELTATSHPNLRPMATEMHRPNVPLTDSPVTSSSSSNMNLDAPQTILPLSTSLSNVAPAPGPIFQADVVLPVPQPHLVPTTGSVPELIDPVPPSTAPSKSLDTSQPTFAPPRSPKLTVVAPVYTPLQVVPDREDAVDLVDVDPDEDDGAALWSF